MRVTFIQACACGKDLNHALHIKPLFLYTPQTLDKCNTYWKKGFDETTAVNLITNYNTQCSETYHQFSWWCAKKSKSLLNVLYDTTLKTRTLVTLHLLHHLHFCCCCWCLEGKSKKVIENLRTVFNSTYPVRHPLFIMNFITFCSDSHGSQRMNL